MRDQVDIVAKFLSKCGPRRIYTISKNKAVGNSAFNLYLESAMLKNENQNPLLQDASHVNENKLARQTDFSFRPTP